MEEEVEYGESQFNSGIAIIYRLDAIHRHIHNARVSRNYNLYFNELIALWMELIRSIDNPKLINKEESDVFKKNVELWNRCQEAVYIINKLVAEETPVNPELWEQLYEWEMELTLLEQKAGLGIPKTTSRRYAAGN